MTGMPRSPAERMYRPDRAWMSIANTTAGRSHGRLEPMDDPKEGFGLATAVFCLGIVAVVVTVLVLYAQWRWG